MSNKRTQGPGRPDDLPPEAAMAGPPDGGAGTYSHGLRLEQLDALEPLLGMIAALGDVLATVQAAELADGTVPVIGQAIHDHARAMRGILDQVEAQRLEAPAGRDRVEEARAGYAVAALGVVADMPPRRGRTPFGMGRPVPGSGSAFRHPHTRAAAG